MASNVSSSDYSELFLEIDFARVNAFSDKFSGGNPAAVCYLPYYRQDEWLQLVAKEFNLSETAFLVKKAAEFEFYLRWFTPKVEVDLCGHATLAAAHFLFSSEIGAKQETVAFHTKSGTLRARKVAGYGEEVPQGTSGKYSSGRGIIELDFPLAPATSVSPEEAARVYDALGATGCALWCGKSDLGDYLVELRSSQDVEQLHPNFNLMLDFPGRGGAIVTAKSRPEAKYDFLSRFFCPKSGILEDPVTGSAHCTLGPYWSSKLGKKVLEAFQASERGGSLTVRVDEEDKRAYLQGCATTVMSGILVNAVTL